MVKFTLGVENEGERITKPGRVHSCEDDHVAYIDGIGNLQYITYARIAHFEEIRELGHFPTEPK